MDKTIEEHPKTDLKKVYGGYYTNDRIMSSSSGGVCNEIAEGFIRQGGIVVGVKYSDDCTSAIYGIAESIPELNSFKGSKYIRPEMHLRYNGETRHVFDVVAMLLNSGKQVLFFALPCMANALHIFLDKKLVCVERLYVIDLICNGVTPRKVHIDFISELTKKYGSELCDFTVRYKKKKLEPLIIKAEFTNGKEIYAPFYNSDYGIAFGIIKEECCYNCNSKGDNRKSEMTVGDYLGIAVGDENYNEKGCSIIIIHTEKSRFLLDCLGKDFYLFEVDSNKPIEFNLK